MKTLYESLLDDFDAIAGAQDAQYKTLRDCMSGHITNNLDRSLGPNYFCVNEYSKLLKKKYKLKPLLDRNGKKMNPQITGDIISIIADQVEIDWSLDPEARLQKALDDFMAKVQELRMPEIEKYRDPSGFDPKQVGQSHVRFGNQTDSYEISYNLGGPGKKVKAMITLTYGTGYEIKKIGKRVVVVGNGIDKWGTYTVNILDTCPICA